MARYINIYSGKTIDAGSEFIKYMEGKGWRLFEVPKTQNTASPTPPIKTKKRRAKKKKS